MIFLFKGNTMISLVLGVLSLLILLVGAFGFLFIGTLKAILVGLIVLIIVFVAFSKFIHNVKFTPSGIEVIRYVGKTYTINYKEINKFYESNDGLLPAPIFVMKYQSHNRKGKITFVCSDEDLEKLLDTYFLGIKIKRLG